MSAAFVRDVRTPGRYGDGRGGFGLSLLVKPRSRGDYSKTWAQRIRVNGKPRDVGLGAYPLVTLKAARDQALTNAMEVHHGRDPRRGCGIPTFEQATARVIDQRRGQLSEDTARRWQARLAKHAFPHLGDKPVDRITRADIHGTLEYLWTDKPPTARKVADMIGAVLEWAVGAGYREDSPTKAAVAGLPPQTMRTEHHEFVPHHSEAPPAVKLVLSSGAHRSTLLAFEFLALTATRVGEVTGARWSEFDGDTLCGLHALPRLRG